MLTIFCKNNKRFCPIYEKNKKYDDLICCCECEKRDNNSCKYICDNLKDQYKFMYCEYIIEYFD
jgi:hypothetical protein